VSARCRRLFGAATVTALAAAPSFVFAQAFTPPRGVGAVTLAGQYVDNTGHRQTDGNFAKRGQSVTASIDVEAEYGVTSRLSVTLGIPYVLAKYTGAMPPPSRLPVDACGCWHSSFQDFSLAARYRLGSDTWAVTPVVRWGRPSHDYPFQGEAVVGRNLQEAQIGIYTGARLGSVLPGLNVQVGYTYAFVEKPLEDITIDRSNAFFELGYSVKRRLYVRGIGVWQRVHGGVRAGSDTGNPFPLPGELNTPERLLQRDRILRTKYWQAGVGLSYSLGSFDVFGSFSKYVWGRDAHNGQAYTVGGTWYFGL
jgi:hypothetical protein